MKIIKVAILVTCLPVFQLFILCCTANGATQFFLIPKNSETEVHCDFLSIKENKAYCKENNTIAMYEFNSIAQISIVTNGKTFKFTEEINSSSDELIDAINTVNEQKFILFRKLEAEQKRKLAKQRDEQERKQEEKERYQRRFNACRNLYDEQCKSDCAENKYQYSIGCYNLCIETHCLD